MDTWRNVSHVSKFKKKKRKGKDKKKKESQKKRRQAVCEREGGEEREIERGKWVFRFSLRSTEMEPSVFVGARRKVDPALQATHEYKKIL